MSTGSDVIRIRLDGANYLPEALMRQISAETTATGLVVTISGDLAFAIFELIEKVERDMRRKYEDDDFD